MKARPRVRKQRASVEPRTTPKARPLSREGWVAGSDFVSIRSTSRLGDCSIESVWRELRDRLADTEPRRMQRRENFIPRLRSAVAWVNRNRAAYLTRLCASQKEWAQDVIDAKGKRTKH